MKTSRSLRAAVIRAHTRTPGGAVFFISWPLRRAAATLAIALLMLGCASGATPLRKSYTTIDDVAVAANQTMQAFNAQYQAGQRSEDQRTQVLAAYAKYQKAMLLAKSVAQDIGQSANALQIANDAIQPLLDLVASFMPPKASLFLIPIEVYS